MLECMNGVFPFSLIYTVAMTHQGRRPLKTISTLEGILGELILLNVKAKEMALREKGLVGLGLCCLIAKVPRRFLSVHLTSI